MSVASVLIKSAGQQVEPISLVQLAPRAHQGYIYYLAATPGLTLSVRRVSTVDFLQMVWFVNHVLFVHQVLVKIKRAMAHIMQFAKHAQVDVGLVDILLAVRASSVMNADLEKNDLQTAPLLLTQTVKHAHQNSLITRQLQITVTYVFLVMLPALLARYSR